LKIDEVAAQLRLSRPTVYRLINSQKLASVHVGIAGFTRVTQDDLDAYIATHRHAAAVTPVDDVAESA
jgi:excisionase family DNA binding protein